MAQTISNHPDIVLDITQLLGRVARKSFLYVVQP
jgi:hypothetical protein